MPMAGRELAGNNQRSGLQPGINHVQQDVADGQRHGRQAKIINDQYGRFDPRLFQLLQRAITGGDLDLLKQMGGATI